MIILKILFILILVLSAFIYCYIQYTKLIRVKDEEIVLGENQDANLPLEDVWMEAFDEVLKEKVHYEQRKS